ncbi:MAG: ORF6N domain-containing protein [Chlamydiota bacterium]
MNNNRLPVPVERIEHAILLIRGHKVMLDVDLADLYGVTTAHVKRAVKRNCERFPPDFMFHLTAKEYDSLRCQFGILKRGQHAKYLPLAFTEQGVAMLSGILRSPRAVCVNIEIMRAFVRLRQILASHKDLAGKLADLEKKYDARFRMVFDAIRQLMTPPVPPRRPIGFSAKEARARYTAPRRKNRK